VRKNLVIGVVAGGVTDIVLTNILTGPIAVYVALTTGVLTLPKDQQSAAWIAALHANFVLYALLLCIGAACSIAGGYVAAWIAKERELVVGACSSFLCVGSEIYALATGKSSGPLWITLLFLPLSPALGAAGGYLRRSGRSELHREEQRR
jgi:hypothetical protein